MNASRISRVLFHPYVLFLVVALAVWWPAGFNIGPTDDGWMHLTQARVYAGQFTTRIFGSFPFRALGMRITPDSFQGWEALLFLATVLRGVLAFELIRRLFPRQRLFAVACGLIALFHPADVSYFWLDAAGISLGQVFVLAALLCSVIYLQTGRRLALLGTLAFQLLACFNYDAFVLVMLTVQALAWLQQRREGRAAPAGYLIKTSALIWAFIVLQAILAFEGYGREGHVMDMSVKGVLAGYFREAGLFLHSAPGFTWAYCLMALVPMAFAYGAAMFAGEQGAATSEAPIPARTLRFVAGGVLLLAAVAYLPFSVSTVRFGNERQLLAAGFFLYMLLLLAVFYLGVPRLKSPHAGFAVLALLAGFVTVTGLDTRQLWVDRYRDVERLLSAVATLVPDPPPGSVFVLHVHRYHPWSSGFYNRHETTTQALRMLYGDQSLSAVAEGSIAPPWEFPPGKVVITSKDPQNPPLTVPYDKLILVDYPEDSAPSLMGRDWLKQQAPSGTDVSGYQPGKFGSAPGKDAEMCVMLEKEFRPAYCQ